MTGSNSVVTKVTVISSCLEGILVGGSNNRIQENSVARSSLAAGAFDASIWVQGTGNHLILNNEISAAGFFNNIFGVPPYPAGGGQGIFVGFADGSQPSKNNLIKENNSSGIPGSGLFVSINSTGNQIIRNQFLGNLLFDDVFDPNTVGSNTYRNNLCEVSQVGPSLTTNICGTPDVSGHGNPEGEQNNQGNQEDRKRK
jgi:hypothetical protein